VIQLVALAEARNHDAPAVVVTHGDLLEPALGLARVHERPERRIVERLALEQRHDAGVRGRIPRIAVSGGHRDASHGEAVYGPDPLGKVSGSTSIPGAD